MKDSVNSSSPVQGVCVAVCCSVLQCVAVCCSELQCAAVCCNALQGVAVCSSVLQRVAVNLCENIYLADFPNSESLI